MEILVFKVDLSLFGIASIFEAKHSTFGVTVSAEVGGQKKMVDSDWMGLARTTVVNMIRLALSLIFREHGRRWLIPTPWTWAFHS